MSNVADVKSKTIKITLNDGVERKVKFTLNALAELEDMYGSVQAAFDKLEKENSMKALRAILWAGLIWDSPDLTEMQVGNLIDIEYMQSLVETLSVAFDDNMVVPEPLPEGTTDPNV
jgi:hypothetical protein